MKNTKPLLIIISILSIISISCSDNLAFDETEIEDEVPNLGILGLNIPKGFDFSTKQEIVVTINDNASYVKYEVYAFSDEDYATEL